MPAIDPGGDPAGLRHRAEQWHRLAARLQAQSDWLSDVSARSESIWTGRTADEFRAQARALAGQAHHTAHVVSAVASSQQQHADQHAVVLTVLQELGIQIAATVALLAAASLFPALLAAAHARLVLLAAQAHWALQILINLLSGVVRFLVQARAWLASVAKLSWRTERMSLAYGRLLYEGGRDFLVDLAATATATAVQKKPLIAADLFRSAAISFAVGGTVGAIEGSGVRKVLSDAGDIVRAADGRPAFVSVGDQYRSLLHQGNKVPDPPARPSAEPGLPGERPGTPGAVGPAERLARAQARARELGIGTTAPEGRRLADDATRAQREHDLAVARDAVGDALRRTDDAVHRYAQQLAEARTARWNAETNHHLAKVSDDPVWIRRTEHELTRTRSHEETVGRLLAEAEAARTWVTRRGDIAAQLAPPAPAETAQRVVSTTERHRAWQEVAAAARTVRGEGTPADRFVDAMRHNPWQEGYPTRFGADGNRPVEWEREDLAGLTQVPLKGMGDPKPVREILLVDGVKDFAKGTANSGINSAVEAAQGRRAPGEVWKDALLGGAFGAVRGVAKAAGGDVLFPKTSIEEVLWRTGTKSLDQHVRDQIKTSADPAQPSVRAER